MRRSHGLAQPGQTSSIMHLSDAMTAIRGAFLLANASTGDARTDLARMRPNLRMNEPMPTQVAPFSAQANDQEVPLLHEGLRADVARPAAPCIEPA